MEERLAPEAKLLAVELLPKRVHSLCGTQPNMVIHDWAEIRFAGIDFYRRYANGFGPKER